LNSLFGYLIDRCYALTGSFGGAIIVFTLLTRVILFPISLASQKNSIILFRIQPQLNDIKARYDGDSRTMLKEQKALYKKEKYSTLKAILPLAIQIPIIIGVVRSVNNAAVNSRYDFAFIGLDLSAVPTLSGALLFIPVLSAVSAFLLCLTQNSLNPLTKAQGFAGKWGTTIFLTAFSGYFAFVCQAGVGLYWIAGNLSGCLVVAICALIYNPEKYVDYENRSVRLKLTKEEKLALKERKRAEKIREKEDVKRFFSCEKQLVFYSEASGFYKYYQHFIEYILNHSDIIIHYVTSDINDRVFNMENPRFKTYYCGYNGLITLMMKMDADVVVLTMPDLNQYQYKRSIVKKNIEYIYVAHGIGGNNMTLRKGALDYFDTIFCYDRIYHNEIRASETVYCLSKKNIINTGFGMLVTMIDEYNASKNAKNSKPRILIAPSWQKDNIFELCLDELLNGIFNDDYKIILRPHPEFAKRFPGKMKLIFDKYADRIGEDFEIQMDFSSNSTVYMSDLVITDWSAIALEFSFTTKKPSLYINTPMKVMNPEWQKIGIEPMDLLIRNKIGISIDTDRLIGINEIVRSLLNSGDTYKEEIENFIREYLYDFKQSAEIGGEYLINRCNDAIVLKNFN